MIGGRSTLPMALTEGMRVLQGHLVILFVGFYGHRSYGRSFSGSKFDALADQLFGLTI